MSLKDKTLLITGASRGIGLAIALRAAKDGANLVIAAKTAEPHPHLPGTVHSAAQAVRNAGGQALPVIMDVRHEEQVDRAVAQAADHFGGIDILVNNASAISWAPVEQTEMKRWDLMSQVNGRGTFLASKAVIPFLRKAKNPHILTIAPPLDVDARWFRGNVAYTISKYAMSMAARGLAEEFREEGIASNALWPRTAIATAAIEFALGGTYDLGQCRKPEIMADAAHAILVRPARDCTGNFFLDDSLLYGEGVRDFDKYRVNADLSLQLGMFVPPDDRHPPGALGKEEI